MNISLKEAKGLLKQFGRCYPTRYGLTPEGVRECERIRSIMHRSNSKILSQLEIRMMAYEDGLHIKPSLQKRPYQKAVETLRKWQSARRSTSERKAA